MGLSETERKVNLLTRQIAITVLGRRHRKGLTQKKLGEICGLSQKVINEMESGRANTKLQNLLKVSDVLKIPMSEFFKNTWPYFETFEGEKLTRKNIFPPLNNVCEINLGYQQKMNVKVDADRQILIKVLTGNLYVRHSRELMAVAQNEYLSSSGYEELTLICDEVEGAQALLIEFPKKEGRVW